MIKAGLCGIVVGASSDIGLAIVQDWLHRELKVLGTFRSNSPKLEELRLGLCALEECDFLKPESINKFITTVTELEFNWDYLVICPGTMEPLGLFESVDINAWCSGIEVNFLATMRVIHGLLPLRSRKRPPLVLLFAGGGTNGAPVAVSAYTVAKIAMVKAIELLDAEISDVRFTIIGPGWVKTKIHEETLRATSVVPLAAEETVRRLKVDDFNPMSQVVNCVAWAMEAPKSLVGGRNFSVAHDEWGTLSLEHELLADTDMYKLRRAGNQLTYIK